MATGQRYRGAAPDPLGLEFMAGDRAALVRTARGRASEKSRRRRRLRIEEEKQIAPQLAGWSSLSVTSKGAYFMTDPRTVKLFDEKTGLISTVAQLGEHSSSTGITVSTDDAYLVFSDWRDASRPDAGGGLPLVI
jgi:hypothetical protein